MTLVRINRQPSAAQLLLFAVAWGVACGWVAVLQWHRASPVSAGFAAVLGVAVLALWRIAPEGVRWLYVGLSFVTYPIGFIVSHVVLAVVYFGVLMPIGLAMRLLGRDPLARRFERAVETYWEPRGTARSAADYLRQR